MNVNESVEDDVDVERLAVGRLISLSPGASDRMLHNGDAIVQTEPALDITQLLQKYAFGSGTEPPPAKDDDNVRSDPIVEDPLR